MSVILRPSVKRTEGRDLVAPFNKRHTIHRCGNSLLFRQIYVENAVTCMYYVVVVVVETTSSLSFRSGIVEENEQVRERENACGVETCVRVEPLVEWFGSLH